MPQIQSQFIEANGLSFHCLTAGDPSRPLLLMLHGFPEYSGGWEEMLERLSDDYFCVAPDQRGYNTSSKPEGVIEYTGGKLARDAAAILTHFAPHARAVIGHDWGASVAYALTFARPDLMDKLIILNGAHPLPFQRALATGGPQAEASQYIDYLRSPKAEARLSADDFSNLAALFADGMDMSWLSGRRLEKYLNAWGQPGALTGMLNWYRATPMQVAKPGQPIPPDEIKVLDPAKLRVKPPHLLIWGKNDTALKMSAHEGLGDLCDDLTIRYFDDADHWIIHQQPDAVAAVIRDYLSV
jgi:epoxide hydrolase 4